MVNIKYQAAANASTKVVNMSTRKRRNNKEEKQTSDGDKVTNLWNIVLRILFLSSFACMADYSIFFFRSFVCALLAFIALKRGVVFHCKCERTCTIRSMPPLDACLRMQCARGFERCVQCVYLRAQRHLTHTDSIWSVHIARTEHNTKETAAAEMKKEEKNETKETTKDIHFKLQTRLMSFDCYWVTGCRLLRFFFLLLLLFFCRKH